MIEWSEKLYLDPSLKGKQRKAMRAVERGKWFQDLYCVLLASNPKNLFDIQKSNAFVFPYQKREKHMVVGLAKGETAARELVRVIVEDVYRETGTLNGDGIRAYFS